MGEFSPRGRRLFPNVVVTTISPNQSSRLGAPIQFGVLHSTESTNVKGKQDLANVAAYLARTTTRASAHVMTDADGNSARMVRDRMKAWHVGNLNPRSLGIEQIGFARQGRKSWRDADHELHETARWIALMSIVHHIPIQHARLSPGGSVLTKGWTTHAYCSSHGAGTDHTDPGEYPMGYVFWLARGYKRAQGRAMK